VKENHMAKSSTQDLPHDLQEGVEAQIAELRAQVDRIATALGERGINLLDAAQDTLEDTAEAVADNTRLAIRTVQHEASAVAEVVKEHPVMTVGAVATLMGLAFAAGYAIAVSQPASRRRWTF